MSDEQKEVKMLVCKVHGEYPESLKNFGCPDCILDELDDEEDEDFLVRRDRKQNFR